MEKVAPRDHLSATCGNYGTALIDSDEELDDTWNGLLVRDIGSGAASGVVVHARH